MLSLCRVSLTKRTIGTQRFWGGMRKTGGYVNLGKKKHLASCKIAELGEVGGAMGKRPCTGTTLKPVFGLKSRGVLLGVYRRK